VEPQANERISVLVVDDQRDAADTVARLLSLMGYDARVAYSGRQALQLFVEIQPRVVIMDLGMPEMDGFEAAARIRLMPKGTSTTIVALTAWGDEMNRRLSREASIDYHVVKPAAAETLQEVLGKIRLH
jgi:CheY-like chemotaxis protein